MKLESFMACFSKPSPLEGEPPAKKAKLSCPVYEKRPSGRRREASNVYVHFYIATLLPGYYTLVYAVICR